MTFANQCIEMQYIEITINWKNYSRLQLIGKKQLK